jgi:hypothetical protein
MALTFVVDFARFGVSGVVVVVSLFILHMWLPAGRRGFGARLVFERGDAVAALLYEPDTHTVIMVDQFRVPTLIARRRDNPATTDG